MPSTQTPPIVGAAIDPPSLRPPIDDATIERVAPSELRARLEELKQTDYAMLLDLGAVDYLARKPRFDVVYHLLKLAPKQAAVAEVGRPALGRSVGKAKLDHQAGLAITQGNPRAVKLGNRGDQGES